MFYLTDQDAEEVTDMASEDSSIDETDIDFLGPKCLVFFSSHSLKTRKKYISFAQFVYFLREVCLLRNFWMIFDIIVNLIIQNWKVNALPSKNIQTEQN